LNFTSLPALPFYLLPIQFSEEPNKDIGKIFRGHNICEIKSVTDYFAISDYAKVIGYASLYAAFKNVLMTDITITIVVTKYPRKLVKFLEKERGLKVLIRAMDSIMC